MRVLLILPLVLCLSCMSPRKYADFRARETFKKEARTPEFKQGVESVADERIEHHGKLAGAIIAALLSGAFGVNERAKRIKHENSTSRS